MTGGPDLVAVLASVAEAAPYHHSTTSLRNALELAGFAPVGGFSKLDIARKHLAQARDMVEPWPAVLTFVQTILDNKWSHPDEPDDRRRARERMLEALRRHGVDVVDGRAVRGVPLAAPGLADAIRKHDMDSVQREFERTMVYASSDPAAAMTAACAALEAVFKTLLLDSGVPLPADQSIKPLWKAARDQLNLSVESQVTESVRALLSGLATTVNAVGDLRTKAGSAHGRGRGAWNPEPRHARLAVAAAQACALFVIEAWDDSQE